MLFQLIFLKQKRQNYEKILSDHKNYNELNKSPKVVLSHKSNNNVEFKNYNHSMKSFLLFMLILKILCRKKLDKKKELNKNIERLSEKLNKTRWEVEKYESYIIKIKKNVLLVLFIILNTLIEKLSKIYLNIIA